jgi:hypothetical protein
LRDVFPAPINCWIDDFQCEKSPGGLIHIAEASEVVLRKVCKRVALTLEQQRRLFEVVMAIPDSIDGRGKGLARDLPKVKGLPRIAKLSNMFWEAWAPVEKPFRSFRRGPNFGL